MVLLASYSTSFYEKHIKLLCRRVSVKESPLGSILFIPAEKKYKKPLFLDLGLFV